jgi:GDPmannose 4,6-dehydratase
MEVAMEPSAMIIGATGQTGAYLTRRLVQNNYRVTVTSRDAENSDWHRLRLLGIEHGIHPRSLNPNDPDNLSSALDSDKPSEIYYLAGPSSVAASFSNPAQSFAEITGPVNTILQTLRVRGYTGSFFNAASTDCFGNQPDVVLDEESAMYPVSPYGVAKSATFRMTKNYREAFGLRASNGILTNHESPLRDSRFVSHKIVSTLARIAAGAQETLHLGNTAIIRDWLWAGDAAEAIHAIGSAEGSDDFLVASGKSRSLDEFVALVCGSLNLEMSSTVVADQSLLRPLDITSLRFNPHKITTKLGWTPRLRLEDIVENLVAGVVNP